MYFRPSLFLVKLAHHPVRDMPVICCKKHGAAFESISAKNDRVPFLNPKFLSGCGKQQQGIVGCYVQFDCAIASHGQRVKVSDF